MFDFGYSDVLESAGLTKIARSALMKRIKYVPDELTPGRWEAMLGDVPVMEMSVDPTAQAVRWSNILDPRFEGMGLGKKMYGEIMRRQPGAAMTSDALMSPFSTRVWERMSRQPGYELWRNPEAVAGGFNYEQTARVQELMRELARTAEGLEGVGFVEQLRQAPEIFSRTADQVRGIRNMAFPDQYPATRAGVVQHGATTKGTLGQDFPVYAARLPSEAAILPGADVPPWLAQQHRRATPAASPQELARQRPEAFTYGGKTIDEAERAWQGMTPRQWPEGEAPPRPSPAETMWERRARQGTLTEQQQRALERRGLLAPGPGGPEPPEPPEPSLLERLRGLFGGPEPPEPSLLERLRGLFGG